MIDQKSWMSDLEKELADDFDGRMLQARKDDLMRYSKELERLMEQGMEREELMRTQEMKRAAECAISVLEDIWRKLRTSSR